MNVCSVHLYVVQIPSAQISWEVTIARVWMDSLQQFQVSPSASITHVQVNPTVILYFKYNNFLNDPSYFYMYFAFVFFGITSYLTQFIAKSTINQKQKKNSTYCLHILNEG